MSFVKKAVKKVFKFVKRLVKNKVFQIVAIIALSVFTAGVAAGGFAAFSGVSSIGGFFTAVGQTMATGMASITSALGMQGTSAAFAAKGGAAAIKAGLVTTAQTAGSIATSAAAASAKAAAAGNTAAAAAQGATAKAAAGMAHTLPAAGTTAAKAAAAGVAKTGVSSTFGKVAGQKVLGEVTIGQMATSAALGGIKNMMDQDARKREFPNGYVAGGTARKGGSYTGGVAGVDISGSTPQLADPEQQIASNTQAEIGEQGETLASQMANRPAEEAGLNQQPPAQDFAGGANLQNYAQQGLAPQEAIVDSGGGQMDVQQQQPQQGLMGDNPFSDQASRIAYNPRQRGLMGA